MSGILSVISFHMSVIIICTVFTETDYIFHPKTSVSYLPFFNDPVSTFTIYSGRDQNTTWQINVDFRLNFTIRKNNKHKTYVVIRFIVESSINMIILKLKIQVYKMCVGMTIVPNIVVDFVY